VYNANKEKINMKLWSYSKCPKVVWPVEKRLSVLTSKRHTNVQTKSEGNKKEPYAF
jgi:hypothetical protein